MVPLLLPVISQSENRTHRNSTEYGGDVYYRLGTRGISLRPHGLLKKQQRCLPVWTDKLSASPTSFPFNCSGTFQKHLQRSAVAVWFHIIDLSSLLGREGRKGFSLGPEPCTVPGMPYPTLTHSRGVWPLSCPSERQQVPHLLLRVLPALGSLRLMGTMLPPVSSCTQRRGNPLGQVTTPASSMRHTRRVASRGHIRSLLELHSRLGQEDGVLGSGALFPLSFTAPG